MLPKPVRTVFYWVLRSGKMGRFIADMIAWVFYYTVKIFRISPKQDIAGLTLISHKYKIIIFCIPKVASRSFYTLFAIQKKQEWDVEWQEKRDYFFQAKKQYPSYRCYSFVRNPISRIISCYNSKIAENIIGKNARILSFYKGLHGGMPLVDFVQWLGTEEGADTFADRHWLSQYAFLYNAQGECLFDFIGRYENLEENWKNICQENEIDYTPLPQKGFVSALGKTNNPSQMNIEDVYKPARFSTLQNTKEAALSEDLKDLLYKRYEKDFTLFGYNKE